MPIDVLQREVWHGEPKELGDLFRLTKNRHQARAALFSHQFGWELRLTVNGSLIRSQVCREFSNALAASDDWQTAMREHGWSMSVKSRGDHDDEETT